MKDGAALCRFLYWLKHRVGKEPITECSAAEKLEQLRKEQPGYLGPSFETIAAYGAHGAIVHYAPTPETDIPLEPKGLFLVDSGGQYLAATTDVTRTVALGPVTEREREMFTLVLRSHLALGAVQFREGCRGDGLDVVASVYHGLYALQHRGQEGAGIVAVDEGGTFRRIKGSGLVTEVFDEAIREAKGPGATPPFRGMSYNASAEQLITMLNIGSISVKTE